MSAQSLFARGNGKSPLTKPVKGARLAAKLLVSGEFRMKYGDHDGEEKGVSYGKFG